MSFGSGEPTFVCDPQAILDSRTSETGARTVAKVIGLFPAFTWITRINARRLMIGLLGRTDGASRGSSRLYPDEWSDYRLKDVGLSRPTEVSSGHWPTPWR